MLDRAQQDLDEIQRLALTPSPQTYDAINTRLESISGFLSALLVAHRGDTPIEDPALSKFLRRLPQEMTRVRTLMQAPCLFYQGLENVCAMHFGSYERSGFVRSLLPSSHGKTLVHL